MEPDGVYHFVGLPYHEWMMRTKQASEEQAINWLCTMLILKLDDDEAILQIQSEAVVPNDLLIVLDSATP
jgi:hypothetical protein